MAKCNGCGKFIAATATGVVSCTACLSPFHKACVSLPEMAQIRKDWICPDCNKIKKVRKGDNSSTPVRGVVEMGPDAAPSAADDSRSPHPATSQPDVVQELRSELVECVAELKAFRKDLREEMAELRASVAGLTARMDGFEKRLEAVERSPAPGAEDVAELERTVNQLKLDLNDRDQEALQSDLEIGHLPEEKGERVVHAVTVLAARLGMKLQEHDVVFAERVGAAVDATGTSVPPRARRVVLRLSTRRLRDQLMEAARSRRSLTAADAGRAAAAGSASPRIYINERLTRVNRLLFHRVREECRKLQWRFAWTKRGRIYVRQADGKPAHHIRSEADVSRVFTGSPRL